MSVLPLRRAAMGRSVLVRTPQPLTIVELALVTAVLGVAAAVAVPAYIHLRQSTGDDGAARSRLVRAGQALELRHSATGTFLGAVLPSGVRLRTSGGSYCVDTTAGGRAWHATRNASPTGGACPSPTR